MIDLIVWLQYNQRKILVPLFETDHNNTVMTKFRGQTQNPILKRHPQMEMTVIQIVEENIHNPKWEGLLYIMIWDKDGIQIPLYIGKAERKGRKHSISANIANIAKNTSKFARWGDALYYHIGDLSHAVFGTPTHKKPAGKYIRWANTLFHTFDPPTLRYPVSLLLIPWFEEDLGPSSLPCSLPSVEKEIIALASVQFSQYLLNVDGT